MARSSMATSGNLCSWIGEFGKEEFLHMRPQLTLLWNLSSHHIIGQILRTILHGTTVKTKAELESAFDDACAVATRVVCCVSDLSSQGNAPEMVAFRRDVNINICWKQQ